MKEFLKIQWQKYKARKTKAGIVIDFLFLVLFIAMIHPTSRKTISSFVIRYTLTAPEKSESEYQTSEKDYAWKYKDLNGNEKSFMDLKGKVIFLNFWATWCPPCVAEFPAIQSLYNDYSEKIEFVLISNEADSVVSQFIKDKEYSIPVYLAVSGLPQSFHSGAFPTTYVISKSGKIVFSKKGAANWNDNKVKELLDKLIEE